MNILPLCTLRKAAVADVKRNRSASKINPGDSRKTHRRNGQLTHTCMKRVSDVHPSLYEGKKGIVIQSTSLGGKSSDKMVKTRSPDELNYVTRQIVEQLPNQVKTARELQGFLNKIQKLTGPFSLFFIFSFIFVFKIIFMLKKQSKNWISDRKSRISIIILVF